MCELIFDGLTYSCGPYTITLCDCNGANCVTVIVTPNIDNTSGTITYSDGSTETYVDGIIDINTPDGFLDGDCITYQILNSEGEVVTKPTPPQTTITQTPSNYTTPTPTKTFGYVEPQENTGPWNVLDVPSKTPTNTATQTPATPTPIGSTA